MLDDPEEWRLPIDGFEVTDVWFSGQLYVIAYGVGDVRRGVAAPRTQIALGGPFRLRTADGRKHDLDAGESWGTLVPVLSLRHARVTAATGNRTGSLVVTFDDGSELSVEPDPRYENWELNGPGALHLVSPPGGGDPRVRP